MLKMMIVDDEAYSREITAELVERHFRGQFQIRLAENGRKAVDISSVWSPDIVLMDIEMPGINGIESARKILETHPVCKVIFITAYSVFHYAQEAVKLGACDYILKPVNEEELTRSIRLAVSQSQAQQQLAMMGNTLPRDNPGDKTAVLMEKIQKHLQYNYMMYDISLDSVSEMLNMNASYFSSLFKKCFGINFVDYLTELRMNAARELLADPMRSTAEVAALVGYESPNYFARAFKKKMGMTPTEYRRSLRGDSQ